MALSKSAMSGVPAAHTVRLVGLLQNVPVNILIDSGSSSSFLNEALVPHLDGIHSEGISTLVQVAGGGMLINSAVLRQVPWTVDE